MVAPVSDQIRGVRTIKYDLFSIFMHRTQIQNIQIFVQIKIFSDFQILAVWYNRPMCGCQENCPCKTEQPN